MKPVAKKSKSKAVGQQLSLSALRLEQSKGKFFYVFTMKASQLFGICQINQRSDDKTEGYQRALSPSRVRSISKYVSGGGVVPGNIILSLDAGEYSVENKQLIIPKRPDVAWVIDGQHRLAGCYEASKDGYDVDLSVAAFTNITIESQIEIFITINREAKGVPSSLYLDLLKHLPRQKTDREIVDERVADIARRINSDEASPFFQRLIFTRTARAGEISLTNFARVVRPHLARPTGVLSLYTQPEQEGALNNYFSALRTVFPKHFKNDAPIFFKTLGFGAVWRAFPLVLNLSQKTYKSFSVAAVSKILKEISDFNFDSWDEMGTGSGAEAQAGDDLLTALEEAFEDDASGAISLKLD